MKGKFNMQLDSKSIFCWKTQTSTTAAYTDALDFGTDGNALFETKNTKKTKGVHGDDILFSLFWILWASTTAADSSITVVWETSDNEPTANTENSDASKVEVLTKTFAAAQLVAGAYLVQNEPLPKGLKRYNRLKITGTAGSDSSVSTKVYPKVSAFIVDGRDEPLA